MRVVLIKSSVIMMCTFEQPSVRGSRLTAYRCNSHLPSWYRLTLGGSVAQLWFASILASHKRTWVSGIDFAARLVLEEQWRLFLVRHNSGDLRFATKCVFWASLRPLPPPQPSLELFS